MGPICKPGSTCLTHGAYACDTGTLCQNASFAPSHPPAPSPRDDHTYIPMGRHDYVRFATEAGRSVLFTYYRGERIWNPVPDRTFLQEGDIILPVELESKDVHRLFPDRADDESREDEASLMLWLLKQFFGYEDPKYTVASRIVKLFHTGGGNGHAELQPVIKAGEMWMALDQRECDKAVSRHELNFQFALQHTGSQFAIPASRFIAECTAAALSAGVGEIWTALGKSISRRALRSGLKRLFVRMIRVMATGIPRASIAFLTAYAKQLVSQTSEEAILRARATHTMPNLRLNDAFAEGAAAFVSSLLSTAGNAFILKKFEVPVDQLLGMNFRQRLASMILKEVIKQSTTGLMARITKATADAWVATDEIIARDKHKTFQDVFNHQMSDKFADSFIKTMEELAKEWPLELLKATVGE